MKRSSVCTCGGLTLGCLLLAGGCPQGAPDLLDLGHVSAGGPVAFESGAYVAPDAPAVIRLTGASPAGRPLEFEILAAPESGELSGLTLVDETSADVIFVPPSGFVGRTSFTFITHDGDITSEPARIAVHVGPPVHFRVAPAAGPAPLTVRAQAYTSDGSPLPDAEFVWDFGGAEVAGPVDTHAATTFTFSRPGTYAVTLSLAQAGLPNLVGCKPQPPQRDSAAVEVKVGASRPATTPTADAGLDQMRMDDDHDGLVTVTLDGSGSRDPDGAIVTYEWRQGRTILYRGPEPRAAVDLPVGKLDVVLTVTDDDGNLDSDEVFLDLQPPLLPACLTTTPSWQNFSLPPQSGTFTLNFTATPAAAAMDGVVTISQGPVTAYANCAVLTRFSPNNRIEARDGAAYRSETSLPYEPGQTYAFRLVINVPAHTYSAYVALPGLGEQTLASDYAFRTEQGGVDELDTWSCIAGIGSLEICGMQVADSGNEPPVAAAGPDQALADDDESGDEPVTLDGSGSHDADGVIVEYCWTEGTTVLAAGSSPTADVNLSVGLHQIWLRVTDDSGATDFDAVGVLVSAGGGGGEGTYVSSISQYGITWTFDGPHMAGQYATGDWWVVGPLTITSISPQPVRSSPGQTNGRNGSMRNPRFTAKQGYDGRTPNPTLSYDAALCVLPPVALAPGDTLVSTESLAAEQSKTFIKSAAVLTVVDAAQPATCFRPPLCRPTRVAQSASDPLRFSTTQLQWSVLPHLASDSITACPALSSSLAKVSRPWVQHFASWTGWFTHPLDNMPAYGQWMSDVHSEVALQLLLDYSDAQLRPLVIGMVQIGIDLYGSYLDSGRWPSDGGGASGRKWPILLAGRLLNHPAMLDLEAVWDGKARFGEDGQTYYYDDPTLPDWLTNDGQVVSEGTPGAFRCRTQPGWVGLVGGGSGSTVLWRIRDVGFGNRTEHEHLHVSAWHTDDSYQKKSDAYRRANTSRSWIGVALAARVLTLQSAWDHPAYFDYCDRWMTENDQAAYDAYVARYGTGGYWPRQQSSGSNFVDQMWATYRNP